MTADIFAPETDDLLARLADAAYRTVLRQGLQQPFVDVELEIWRQIRGAYEDARIEEPGLSSRSNGRAALPAAELVLS